MVDYVTFSLHIELREPRGIYVETLIKPILNNTTYNILAINWLKNAEMSHVW
jgi:hypothetical protein